MYTMPPGNINVRELRMKKDGAWCVKCASQLYLIPQSCKG